ncbi:MAG: hypothetical protein EPO26_14515 [Chloroflexota bacterium]|nr:MAG: hypothetical protein EPO26_14515 [Chloroflexota bacterium]
MTDSQVAEGPQIQYEVEERSLTAIVGAILLTLAITVVGFIPVFVGLSSERRDPGGGYIVLGLLTGLGHIVLGFVMFFDVLTTVGSGRGKTISRLARKLSHVSFMPTLDFFIGLFGVGFGTVYLFAYTQTIADLPRLPRYALGYTLDGWLGIWILWAAVLGGCFFWALWIDAILGRDPRPKVLVELPEDEYDEE